MKDYQVQKMMNVVEHLIAASKELNDLDKLMSNTLLFIAQELTQLAKVALRLDSEQRQEKTVCDNETCNCGYQISEPENKSAQFAVDPTKPVMEPKDNICETNVNPDNTREVIPQKIDEKGSGSFDVTIDKLDEKVKTYLDEVKKELGLE